MDRTLFISYTDPHGCAVARSASGERFVVKLPTPHPTGWARLSDCALAYSPDHSLHPCITARFESPGPSHRPSPARSAYVTLHANVYAVSDGSSPPIHLRVGARASGVIGCSSDTVMRCKVASLLRDHDVDHVYSNVPLDIPGQLLSEMHVLPQIPGGGACHADFVERAKITVGGRNVVLPH